MTFVSDEVYLVVLESMKTFRGPTDLTDSEGSMVHACKYGCIQVAIIFL